MQLNYRLIMDYVFVSEGGYAERPSEPGGAVNMGISFTAFKDYWHKMKFPGEPTWADLKALTREKAEEIYATWFFKPIKFDQLPSGVDYAMVDFAVNSGVGGSIRSIQREMKFPPTGKIDTNNPNDAAFFWALRARDHKAVIDDIFEARLRLMIGSKNWDRFQKNWTNRLKLVKTRCYDMAGIDSPVELWSEDPEVHDENHQHNHEDKHEDKGKN